MPKLEYHNIDFAINGSGLMAQSISLDAENGTQQLGAVGFRNKAVDVIASPLIGKLNITYYYDVANDHHKKTIELLKTGFNPTGITPDSFTFGGLSGQGYLNSFNFSAETNQMILANASYAIFNPISGTLSPKRNFNYNPRTGMSLAVGWYTFFNSSANVLANEAYYNLQYSVDMTLVPIYNLSSGNSPTHVQFMNGQERFRVTRDFYTGFSYSGGPYTGYLNMTERSTIDLFGLAYVGSDQRFSQTTVLPDYSISFNVSGSNILSHSINAQVDDFVKVTSVGEQYF